MKVMHEFRHAITILVLGCILATSIPGTAQAEYNPKLGRFVQRDPNETGALYATALARNAQTRAVMAGLGAGTQYLNGLNLFEYTGSNPINRYDPAGLDWGYEWDVDDIAAEYYAERAAHQIEVIAQARVLAGHVGTVMKGMAKRMVAETVATAFFWWAPYAFTAYDVANASYTMYRHGFEWEQLAAFLYAGKMAVTPMSALGHTPKRGLKPSAGTGVRVKPNNFGFHLRKNQAAYHHGSMQGLGALSQIAKRRLAKVLGGVARSAQPVRQGKYGRGTKWWEYKDSSGKIKIVVEHPDGSVHVGTPKPQSTHLEGGPPKYYQEPGTGHVGDDLLP